MVHNSGIDPTRYFRGSIDELSVWNKVLSAGEVVKLYENHNKNYTELSSSWTPKWDNIIGYWKMDGHWQDSSGNGHSGVVSGTNNNATFNTNSRVGSQSGTFDGDRDLVTITNHTDFNLTNQISVTAWVQPKINHTTYNRIVEKYFNTSWYFGTKVGFNNSLSVWLNGTPDIASSGANAIPIDQWSFISFTYDKDSGGSDELKIYVNGEVVATGDYSLPIAIDSNDILIGGFKVTPTTYDFNGLIDDVTVWSTSLEQQDLLMIYNRQKQKYAGSYDSEIIDLGNTIASWPDLSWSTNLPFGKELIGDFNYDGNPDSESSSDYPWLIPNLNTGLVGQWYLNEKQANSAPSGLDIQDFSGLDNHGDESGGVSYGSSGLFNSSLTFDGTSTGGTVPHSSSLSPDTAITVSAWFNISNLLKVDQRILSKAQAGGYYLAINSGDGFCPNVLCFMVNIEGIYRIVSYPITNLKPGQWYHVVGKFDGSILSLTLNGESVGTPVNIVGQITYSVNSPFCIGSEAETLICASSGTIEGRLDEISIWNRALSDAEALQLYRRGANRIKFQVKSCVDSSCECKSFNSSPVGSATDCDGDTIVNALDFDDIHKADFIGPGGDSTTYYSELFNRKATDLTFNCGVNSSDSNSNVCVNDEITLGANPRPTSPVIDYSDFPLQARPDANPYFQYRVYMEADKNIACNGSPCLPVLTSVDLNPNSSSKYYGSLQEVKPNNPISYKAIQSATITADDCVTFQLSTNGTDYYYWDSSSWAPVTLVSHRTIKTDVESYITNFSTQFGPGELHIKTFLQTNSNQNTNCSIQEIDIKYSQN